MVLGLRVNPIKCTGHGMCAELLPEIVRLDPWGYPITTAAASDVPPHLHEHARRAAAACPVLALLIDESATRPAATSASSRPVRRPDM